MWVCDLLECQQQWSLGKKGRIVYIKLSVGKRDQSVER